MKLLFNINQFMKYIFTIIKVRTYMIMLLSFKYLTDSLEIIKSNKPSLLYKLLIVLTYIYYIVLKKYACMRSQ